MMVKQIEKPRANHRAGNFLTRLFKTDVTVITAVVDPAALNNVSRVKNCTGGEVACDCDRTDAAIIADI